MVTGVQTCALPISSVKQAVHKLAAVHQQLFAVVLLDRGHFAGQTVLGLFPVGDERVAPVALHQLVKVGVPLAPGVVDDALEEYTGTPAYAQRVADALARRAPEISGKCTVRLRRADEALLAPVVKKALPSADIAVDGSIRLGGVKLETQHILYDETLDFAAAAERAAFLTRCKLRVE